MTDEVIDTNALEAEARAVDQANIPQAPAADAAGAPVADPAQPAPVDRTAEAKMLLGLLRPAVELALPYVKDAPAEEWSALEEPIGELLNHYNVDMGEWFTSPWVKLAVAAAPLAVRGFTAWQAEVKAKAEKKDDSAPAIAASDPVAPAGNDPVMTARA